jgi:hypothetical protein
MTAVVADDMAGMDAGVPNVEASGAAVVAEAEAEAEADGPEGA